MTLVLYPARAEASAIPRPMIPAPMTTTSCSNADFVAAPSFSSSVRAMGPSLRACGYCSAAILRMRQGSYSLGGVTLLMVYDGGLMRSILALVLALLILAAEA